MVRSFPKVFTLGTKYIADILKDPVEVTEKIDGSQFNFGKTMDGEVWCKSRNQRIYPENPQMFKLAVDHVFRYKECIPFGWAFHCEYLMKPKHNTLVYGRVPQNNLICFGISKGDETFLSSGEYEGYAAQLGMESVPVLYMGKLDSMDDLKALLERESVLGNCKIEGVVIKNYNLPCWVGGVVYGITCGKFVSEQFKEKHIHEWKKGTNKFTLDRLVESYRAEGRWEKAIQHLKEKGELLHEPQDIGPLIREIHNDIEAEEKDAIKDALWTIFKKEFMNKSTAGFPEWYKEKIAWECFNHVDGAGSAGEALSPQTV